MTRAQIAELVRRIANTLEDELDCGDCGKHVPVYVDAILAGEERTDRWALVRQHLEQCSVCAQEFVTLQGAAKMDLEDNWPTLAMLVEKAARHELGASTSDQA